MKPVPGVLPETLEFIKLWRYDQLLEKHEGPENWAAAIHWEGAAVFEHERTRLLLPREPDDVGGGVREVVAKRRAFVAGRRDVSLLPLLLEIAVAVIDVLETAAA